MEVEVEGVSDLCVLLLVFDEFEEVCTRGGARIVAGVTVSTAETTRRWWISFTALDGLTDGMDI